MKMNKDKLQIKNNIIEQLSSNYKEIIELTGEDSSREGLIKTPLRASKAIQFLTNGYNLNPSEILKSAIFNEKYNEMVLVKDIEIYSLCEHHLLPFFGKCHVAYIPNGKVVGLSKIPRLIDAFARRFQVQERLTTQIRDCIDFTLKPQGVAVCIDAKHLCMQMRGVEKQNSSTTTSAFSGCFIDNDKSRNEFLNLIK
jgi:GTP cyclohydrolase I